MNDVANRLPELVPTPNGVEPIDPVAQAAGVLRKADEEKVKKGVALVEETSRLLMEMGLEIYAYQMWVNGVPAGPFSLGVRKRVMG